jgi:hypothetical protein
MTRPRGEIREALGAALNELGGGTWRDFAQHARVGFDAAKQTMRDMARAGEAWVDGEVKVPGSCRPMVRYVPPRGPEEAAGVCALDAAMRSWADFN